MKYVFRYTLDNLPLIEIKLVNGNKEIISDALIDTGADYTIFPKDVAKELEIDTNKGEMIILEGAGLGKIVAYKHSIKIVIEDVEVNSVACFSIENDIPENLIGRRDLIENFRVIFERDKFYLEPV